MCFEVRKNRQPFFSCQFLLLSTSILNDNAILPRGDFSLSSFIEIVNELQ